MPVREFGKRGGSSFTNYKQSKEMLGGGTEDLKGFFKTFTSAEKISKVDVIFCS